MLLILAFVLLAGALTIAGQALSAPKRARQASLRRASAYSAVEEVNPHTPMLDRLNDRYGTGLARLAGRLDPRATEERIGFKLVTAGLARSISPTGFLATKVVLGGLGIVLGAFVGVLAGGAGKTLIAAIALGLGGFFAPDLVITSRTRRRREEMRRELPDALDILAVSVEAGLGFEAALAKLNEHMEGPLVEEFALVLAELRIGESRGNALRKMAERADIPELTTVVGSLIQAEQLGSPLGRMLRVQAQESRFRRQMSAEERAMKAPVKMIVPTAVFIFPALFIVIIAPAMITIVETL